MADVMRFRAAPARGIDGKVDRDKGIIHGIAVVTMGEAKGHGVSLDEEFIDATVKNGNNIPKGLKSRFGHPNMSSSAVGTLLGRVKNFRKEVENGVPIARGDLHLTESAKTAPQGDLYTHVLDLAEHDPDQFGTSIVFERGDTYKRNKEGEKVGRFNQDGTRNSDYSEIEGPEFVEQKALRADDVVDEPAANPNGLFSAFSADQPAAVVTQFLDENPDVFELLKSEDIESIFSAFRARYESYKADKGQVPTNTKEEPIMAEDKNKDQGRDVAVAELTSLKKAFPSDLAFAVEAFEAGKSVEQAKAERHDILQEQLIEAKAQIAELSKAPEAPEKVEGTLPVDHLEAGLGDGPVELSAQDKFDAFKEESGLDHNAAVTAFAKNHPQLIDELTQA